MSFTSNTQKNLGDQKNLSDLLSVSDEIKVFTCEDFGGNIEVTVGKYMYLFYASKLQNSAMVLSEPPVDVFDMDIEQPTPGSGNYISVDIASSSIDARLNQLLNAVKSI